MQIDTFFDKVYVLNLHKRSDRLQLMKKRLAFCEIDEYEVFGATDGSVMKKVWESMQNPYFKNPNYLGCAISHLSIYRDAVEKGYGRILIIEDDCRINANANKNFQEIFSKVHLKSFDLLYLGFIPLSDDCAMWDYGGFSYTGNLAHAKNFWGLYGYGISQHLMREMLEVYDREFPMEIDRYFVTHVQPRGNSYGITPQIFAADDGYSDNSRIVETGMLNRSIDQRFAKLIDYI